MPMPMPICSLQMVILHAQYITLLSIIFPNAETLGAIPVPEAIAVAVCIYIAIPDAVTDADANL